MNPIDRAMLSTIMATLVEIRELLKSHIPSATRPLDVYSRSPTTPQEAGRSFEPEGQGLARRQQN